MDDGQSVAKRHGVAAEEDPGRQRAPPTVHEAADGADDDKAPRRSRRVASLDVFRGLSVALMILVDGAGGEWPVIGHAPWNGCNLGEKQQEEVESAVEAAGKETEQEKPAVDVAWESLCALSLSPITALAVAKIVSQSQPQPQ